MRKQKTPGHDQVFALVPCVQFCAGRGRLSLCHGLSLGLAFVLRTCTGSQGSKGALKVKRISRLLCAAVGSDPCLLKMDRNTWKPWDHTVFSLSALHKGIVGKMVAKY